MKDVAFSEPIILQLPGVGPRKVATSFEAIECLENQWPQGARESSWRSAHSVCRDALDGWRSAKSARRSFLKAASCAGILLGQQYRSIPFRTVFSEFK